MIESIEPLNVARFVALLEAEMCPTKQRLERLKR